MAASRSLTTAPVLRRRWGSGCSLSRGLGVSLCERIDTSANAEPSPAVPTRTSHTVASSSSQLESVRVKQHVWLLRNDLQWWLRGSQRMMDSAPAEAYTTPSPSTQALSIKERSEVFGQEDGGSSPSRRRSRGHWRGGAGSSSSALLLPAVTSDPLSLSLSERAVPVRQRRTFCCLWCS